MLSKKRRLTRQQVDSVMRGGKTHTTPLFSIKYLPIKDGYGFSCVVSKKVAKKAVERNALKRRIYRFLEQNRTSIAPFRALIILKKGVLEKEETAILEELQKTLKNIGIFR